MSLTSELADPASGLTRWCRRTFVDTWRVVDEVRAAVTDVLPVRPTLPGLGSRHWAEVGGACGQRVAQLVQPAPPYGALLGMVRAEWVTPAWAHAQAAAFPTHHELPTAYRGRALDLRPARDGWVDLRLGLANGRRTPGPEGRALAALLEQARADLAGGAPCGALGDGEVERRLARAAWALSACEDVYRGRKAGLQVVHALARGVDPGRVADAFLVDELVAIARRLRGARVPDQLRALAGDPEPGAALGIASPTIVPRWAEADVIVGRTLVDVKAVITLRDDARIARWLWQVALYGWLDREDVYGIRRVGLLLARHGVLVTWPLDELVERLMGRPGGSAMAQRTFAAIVHQAITAAGNGPARV